MTGSSSTTALLRLLRLFLLVVPLVACGGRSVSLPRAVRDGLSGAEPAPSRRDAAPLALDHPADWFCVPPAPSPGCDFCGKLTCPAGTHLDSACKCLSGTGYVNPLKQECDFCCGKTCQPGEFLDFECTCYRQ